MKNKIEAKEIVAIDEIVKDRQTEKLIEKSSIRQTYTPMDTTLPVYYLFFSIYRLNTLSYYVGNW